MTRHSMTTFFDDPSLMFAAGAQQRLAHCAVNHERPMTVALQGTEALACAAELSGCSSAFCDRARGLIHPSWPVRFVPALHETLTLHATEGDFDLSSGQSPPHAISAHQVTLGCPALDSKLELWAISDARLIGTWACLSAADCAVLIPEHGVDATQMIYLLSCGQSSEHSPAYVFGHDPSTTELLARMRVNAAQVRSVGELQRTLLEFASRATSRATSAISAAQVCEAELLREQHRLEMSFLTSHHVPPTQEAESQEAAACDQFQRGVQRFDDALERIDRELALNLEHHLQAGGPLLRTVENLLESLPLVSFDGWDRVVTDLNLVLPVISGVFVGETCRLTDRRVAIAIRESFGDSDGVPSARLPRNLTSLFRPLPHVESVGTWNTILSGGIKGLLSERMSPLGTRFLPWPVRGLVDHGLAMVTAADNVKKVVRDELRSQVALTVIPTLGSLMQPVFRDLSVELRTTVRQQQLELFEGRLEDIRRCIDRCRLLASASVEDRNALATEGISDFQNSLKSIELFLESIHDTKPVIASATAMKPAQFRDVGDSHLAEMRPLIESVILESLQGTADDVERVWRHIQNRDGRPTLIRDGAFLAVELEFSPHTFDHDWDCTAQVFFLAAGQVRSLKSRQVREWSQLPDPVRQSYTNTGNTEQRVTLFPGVSA